LTVGGDRLNYSGDVATSTADITTFKILINSTLSTEDAAMMMMDIKNVNTSGKAGAQIPHLPLGDYSSPLGGIMQYVGKLTRFIWMFVTSHSQPLINTKYKIPSNKLILNNN
jgi:hypothetical protein